MISWPAGLKASDGRSALSLLHHVPCSVRRWKLCSPSLTMSRKALRTESPAARTDPLTELFATLQTRLGVIY